MPQLVKKRRSGWAVLAVCALVASILAVGASPTAAQPGSTITPATPDHNPEFGAVWSACVGAAGTHDAMFSDVSEDSVHADDIGCIAYYDITIGMGDGTYAPDNHVTAFEMRLFVQRAADLMGADGEAVLAGVELSDYVTRLEMAQLMYGLVDDVRDDVRIDPSDGQIKFRAGSVWVVVNDFFADAKAQVPIAESQLVGAAYELGITRGTKGDGTLVSTPDSTFEPFANVTRAEMASFIARTLDHSNLRPEGLTMQRNLNRNTQASYRDADFAPIEDALIDVFSAQYDDDAFDADDGECELRFVRDETPSHSTCAIDIGDQPTDADGNVEWTLVSDVDPVVATCSVGSGSLDFLTDTGSEDRAFWAWTGDSGDEVSSEVSLTELESSARPVGSAAARLCAGLRRPAHRRRAGPDGRDGHLHAAAEGPGRWHPQPRQGRRRGARPLPQPVRPEDREVHRHTSRRQRLRRRTAKTGTASTSHFAAAPGDWNFGTDALGPVPEANARIQTPFDTVVWPNGDGEYAINLTHPDLNAGSNDNDVGVRFTLRPFAPGNDLLSANLVNDIDVPVFADGSPKPNHADSTTRDAPPAMTTGHDIGDGCRDLLR